MKKGITAMELIITVIIISILVMVALPSFHVMQEGDTGRQICGSLDKEAYSTLKRMQEAEKLYNMENSTVATQAWYPSSGTESDISLINQNLRLSLSTAATPIWNYALKFEAAGACVQATRNGDDGRIWHLEIADNADTCTDWFNNQTGACP